MSVRLLSQQSRHTQAGFGMLEVLVAMVLLTILGLSLTKSAIVSLRYQKYADVGNAAKNLAVSKAEQLSGILIDQLTDSYDGTETGLTVTGHKVSFTRVTNITVNSDGSRTIDITVSSTSKYLPKAVSYQTKFAPWES